jgi:hypothetical protein
MQPPPKKAANAKTVFVKSYKHYRTGKIMIASEYGYTSWKFLSRK